ncbi:MAG: AAA family ATPase, partial [Anaerolineales bacterium]|nr:AAA family ATPase [Anaerolineales bacterium]
AVGTDRGNLNLYDRQRSRIWPRTLNKPITTLAAANLETGPALIVGTAVGTVTAFSGEGRRLWTRQLAEQANRPIIALAALPYLPDDRQPHLSAILGSENGGPEPNDIWLLGSNGRTLDILEAKDSSGLSQLTDINRDKNSEMMLANFASVELLGIGLGSSEQAQEWRYSLETAPRSMLVTDIDLDGEEELLVGSQNGRLLCLNNDNRLCWLTASGEPITHLGVLNTAGNTPPNIVIVRNSQSNNSDTEPQFSSWLEVRQANSERIWDKQFDGEITALLIENINERGQPEIIVGTRTGQVIAFTSTGTELWSHIVEPPYLVETDEGIAPSTHIKQILPQQNLYTNVTDLLVVTPQIVYKINNNLFPRPIIQHDSNITDLFLLDQPGGELATRIVVFLEDGTMRGHNWDGIQLPQWPLALNAVPISSVPANEIITEAFQQTSTESFLVATNTNELMRISIDANEPRIMWQQDVDTGVSTIFLGDLDGDALPDLGIGSTNDKVQLFTNVTQNPDFVDELLLSGEAFALTTLQRNNDQKDLVILTKNGEIELFRAQENRPPLLTNPQTEVRPGQVSFSIDVIDVEQDEVSVELQIQDTHNADEWHSYGSRTTNSNDPLFWPAVDLPPGSDVRYQFVFSDGSYTGTITPPPISPPPAVSPLRDASPVVLALLLLLGIGTAVIITHQSRLPAAQARRFYRQLDSAPQLILTRLEKMYSHTNGSQDFLLNLASQARQQENETITNLADGLFLLPDRPNAGLSIILSTLDISETEEAIWDDHARWLQIYKTCHALLTAPTITELSLLRPQVVQMLSRLEAKNQWSPILDALLPIMTNLRDSERVDSAEDRIVYLNEALHQLYEQQLTLPEFSTRIEKTLVAIIIDRWLGLINAEAEELRGRAELVITLKTKRLVSGAQTELVIEIANNGRAPAENIVAELDDDPAFEIISPPQSIAFLPPGRSRQLSFAINPKVIDRFRTALMVTYDDRNQRDKKIAFGDMVHLLLPARNFNPITNPYLPGTPLRPNSTVFYGREQLFKFIAENVGGRSQRNVLILIGHRRTGKTSALLRLEDRLPSFLLPVYIDCQSLGVLPGMPALFHDLAWLIADVLAKRDIELDVPEPPVWEKDPTGLFQRKFLPYVRSLLPEETRLLLVFDEFEAFESLVEDGILPPTFFTFMRHLMQHSEGLGFVFVGTQRLEAMSANYWSVLFNIALYEHIRYLSEEAAIRLISEPVAPHLIYDDLAIDKILRVTAGHPYFLQLVCYTLVKRANSQRTGYVTISDVNAGLDEMLSLGEVHFAYLWQRSSFAERAILTAVAHMMDKDIAFYPEDFIDYLQSYGIHLSPTEATAALNRLVEREIMQEASRGATIQYELRIGLVGLWVAKHKSLSKLHADDTQREKRPLLERT